MAGGIKMTTCNYHEQLVEALATETISAELQSHLQQCADCRQEQQRYDRLMESLIHHRIDSLVKQAEQQAELPREKLPPAVQALVKQRKKQWLKTQVRQVLGSQDITDKKKQQEHLDRLLSQPDQDLPLAATPDDLHEDEE